MDGAGILYGSGSGGITTGELGSVAHILYRKDPLDKIEIFPGLKVSGSIISTAVISGTFNGEGSNISNILVDNIPNFNSSVISTFLPVENIYINNSNGQISASVQTDGNITGSGNTSNKIGIKPNPIFNTVTSSYFIGDGYNLTNLPTSIDHVLYVAKDGLDTNSGSLTDPFLTIQAAINYASTKYTNLNEVVQVKIFPGVYSGFDVTRRNVYFSSEQHNTAQRSVTLNTPVKISAVGTSKYGDTYGFDGLLFTPSSTTNEPALHVMGSGSYGVYVQNCQLYSNTTGSNANLIRLDGNYSQEKVIIKDCVIQASTNGADLLKITGGDVEIDSCRFYGGSGVASSTAISASGTTAIVINRALFEHNSNQPAISYSGTGLFSLTNSSITKGGAARAIETVSQSGSYVIDCYFASYVVPTNYANINTNLTISGSNLYYSKLTSLLPAIPPLTNGKVTVLNGIPLNDLLGNTTVNSLSSSGGVTGSFVGNGSQITNITASNITNFSTDVRAQFSAGENIYISPLGVITSSVQTAGNITGSGTAIDKIGITPNPVFDTVTASYVSASDVITNYINFVHSTDPAWDNGRVWYNNSTHELNYWTEVNGLNVKLGQQLVQRCQNDSGISLAKGTVVHLTGSTSSDTPRINLADWTNDNLSANTLGLVAEPIDIGATGYVIVQGILKGINTNGYQPGEILYLSSSGQYTNIKPQAPKHTVSLGQVVRKQNSNGSIYVSIQNGYEITELHDVSINGSQTGDLLVRDNGLWKNSSVLSGSYVIDTSGSSAALRVTQKGTGDSILVEDTQSVDTTPFVVKNDGKVGIGLTAPISALQINGNLIQGFSAESFIGLGAHAEGNNTFASGSYSHAEGYYSEAIGYASHAEGQNCIASGSYSHAEGIFTIAQGAASRAEGRGTYAVSIGSHAQGSASVAQGGYSRAEGFHTLAFGYGAHAEGSYTTASGESSHAEGQFSIASGNLSHAEGIYTNARGPGSHAEGVYSEASGPYSHVEGLYTNANGTGSFSSGICTTASSDFQSVIGICNETKTNALHIIGNGNYTLNIINNIPVPTVNSRSNILEVYQDNITVSGSFNVTNAVSSSQITGSVYSPQLTKLTNSLGNPGEICWDANYIYVCTALNTWKSSSLN